MNNSITANYPPTVRLFIDSISSSINDEDLFAKNIIDGVE